jgi:cell wall-associated NlpC family hydrolase
VLFFSSLLSACSTTSSNTPNNTVTEAEVAAAPDKVAADQAEEQSAEVMKAEDLLFILLRNEFQYWQGTPYRLGGETEKGIDCSALVQNIYRRSFNLHLPRVTKEQVKAGFFVYRNELQVADLVFFKINRQEQHVGIYLGDMQFIHASTSKGVMISSLKNQYWKSKYWQSRRIID